MVGSEARGFSGADWMWKCTDKEAFLGLIHICNDGQSQSIALVLYPVEPQIPQAAQLRATLWSTTRLVRWHRNLPCSGRWWSTALATFIGTILIAIPPTYRTSNARDV